MTKKGKILITGGAGYIGSHTCIALQERGYTPVIADNFSNSDPVVPDLIESVTGSKPECFRIDLTDQQKCLELFRQLKPDGVIHFAALKSVTESVNNPLEYYRNNLVSTINILEGMQESGCRKLVFSSSCTVYGEPDQLPVTENAPFKPATSPYGETKQMCERIIMDTSRQLGLPTFSLRYFNPIGAHPSGKLGEFPSGTPNNLLPYLTGAVSGKLPPLKVYGNDYDTPDGTCIRDYIHVCDLAEAHVSAIESLKDDSGFTAVNLGTGTGYSVKQIIDTFEQVTGEKVPHTQAPRRPGDVEKVWGDISLARKTINWEAKRSLREMLQDAWNWEKSLNSKK